MKRLLEKLLTFIGFGPSPCSAWRTIEDVRPEIGDLIACSARDDAGDPIYWAGHVIEKDGDWDIMKDAGERDEPFILTPDTLWIKIPEPNVKASDR